MSKSRKDYIYNLLYQIFNLLFPIILTPYTSRVLGAKCIGIYSYIFTFVSYFTMFSILGISNLGSRLIAKNKDDLESISKTFFSLYYIQLFMSLLMTLLYFIFSFLFLKDNLNIALIQSIFIFSSIFDVWWLFNGLEKFKLNIIKNMLVKISTLILIFIFVKNENDLWIYTLIMVSSTLIINLLWWIFLKKEIKFVKVEFKDIKKNIKPSLLLFLPILFQSIYTSMDKLMLGTMTTMIEVGLYEQAAKFMKIPYAFTNALSYVMLPKNSNLVKKNKNIEDNMKKSFEFIMFLILL